MQGKGPPAKQRSVHLGRTLALSNCRAVQGWASLLSLQKMPEGRMSASRICTVGYLQRLSRVPVHPCGSSSSPGCVRSREHLGDIPHYRLRGLESCSQTSSIWSRFPRAKHGQTRPFGMTLWDAAGADPRWRQRLLHNHFLHFL